MASFKRIIGPSNYADGSLLTKLCLDIVKSSRHHVSSYSCVFFPHFRQPQSATPLVEPSVAYHMASMASSSALSQVEAFHIEKKQNPVIEDVDWGSHHCFASYVIAYLPLRFSEYTKSGQCHNIARCNAPFRSQPELHII